MTDEEIRSRLKAANNDFQLMINRVFEPFIAPVSAAPVPLARQRPVLPFPAPERQLTAADLMNYTIRTEEMPVHDRVGPRIRDPLYRWKPAPASESPSTDEKEQGKQGPAGAVRWHVEDTKSSPNTNTKLKRMLSDPDLAMHTQYSQSLSPMWSAPATSTTTPGPAATTATTSSTSTLADASPFPSPSAGTVYPSACSLADAVSTTAVPQSMASASGAAVGVSTIPPYPDMPNPDAAAILILNGAQTSVANQNADKQKEKQD